MLNKQIVITYMFRLCFAAVMLMGLVFSCFAKSAPQASGEEIRFYVGGWSPLMRRYQEHVIKEMLDRSVDKFGPFKLTFMEQNLTEGRIFQEVARGEVINLSVTPTLREANHGQTIEQIRVPIYHGILGLRKLIIRAGEYERFSKIKSFDDFRQLTVGQGMQWKDVSIYRQSSVKVVESFSFRALFPMLAANRFDFISLGLVEIDEALEREKAHEGKLAIHDDLYVFYPFPVYFNVNTSTPELGKRIRYAKKQYIGDGSLDKAFEKHFTEYIKRIYYAGARVFIFNNPSLSVEENNQAIDDALLRYFSNRSQVFYPQAVKKLPKNALSEDQP